MVTIDILEYEWKSWTLVMVAKVATSLWCAWVADAQWITCKSVRGCNAYYIRLLLFCCYLLDKYNQIPCAKYNLQDDVNEMNHCIHNFVWFNKRNNTLKLWHPSTHANGYSCITPSEQFFSYIMARKSYISMRYWNSHCTMLHAKLDLYSASSLEQQ